ncbi:hypothetical protein ANANG_G00299400 [Anguilla anguilla]|uniref:Heparan-alpha-glucosaminide N-acetyltransferase catalytic domain-containing protein n=1 Tax=Anguilla anguilla TaxID=7936 RepID=A0A9D3LHT8_ANGAN|nr:hypothetical protein ANANG_G00299400 [Anguilla anguilla]
MDEALLTVHNDLQSGIRVSYVSDHCYKCLYQPLLILPDGPSNASLSVSTRFTLTLIVEADPGNSTPCRWSQLYGESGHYSVWVQPSGYPDNITCVRTLDKEPINSYLPLLAAAVVLFLLAVLYVSTPYLYRWLKKSKCISLLCCRRAGESSLDCDASCSRDVEQMKPASSRLRSLDTFRGLSLIVMVFVNYGGGQYWFFQHAPWNGLTVADFVMPWFVFILGTSVVLAFSSLRRKGAASLQLLRKLTWRSAVLILIGFCFINYSPRDGLLSWSWARVPGVLQRLGFTYLILGLMQIVSPGRNVPQQEPRWWDPLQDVVLYWPQWVFVLLLEAVWLCVTFLLPVPGCPTGYVGAGGIGDDGLYPNCTGGAAGYIDRWLLGDNIYRHPTCKELYRTTQPFDPEGVLGTINSVVMGFAGMQAGKILLVYRKRNSCILKRFLIWATLLGAATAVLSKCTRDRGFIPVNKNLWSLSYVTCMGSSSFLLLALLYFLIDVKGWWAGQPFIYPGMNSIFVYVGHSLLGPYFPFSWEMKFTGDHWEALFRSLWGTSLWICIAYLLYRKSFFLKI